MRTLLRQLRPSILATIAFVVVCGLVYPLVVTAIGQAAFHGTANGSLIERNGAIVGSELIGQQFTASPYFHSRPSAAGSGYDGAASSGSNLGPLSADLLDAVRQRVAAYRTENGLAAAVPVPVDAVTASASGLDPDISVANARLQTARVAAARHLDPTVVTALVDKHTSGRTLGLFGEPRVNVLQLNLALDDLAG